MEKVDLGLSVKWADCNVGTNDPSGYGHYFAWGETQPKHKYDLDNYKCRKYNPTDGLTTLELEDDAAAVNCGENWRTPTEKEFNELIDNCEFEWTNYYDVNGYKVTSKINGNSIFLPATGFFCGNSLYLQNEIGVYYSSTLNIEEDADEEEKNQAFSFSMSHNCIGFDSKSRSDGFTIRPVCE